MFTSSKDAANLAIMNSYARGLCLCAFSLNSAGCQSATPVSPAQTPKQGTNPKSPSVVSFCDLFKNSKEYVGRSVTMTFRIMAAKHVTGIWDPACRGHGADLHFSLAGAEDPSVTELEKVLRQNGMGDHPVIATLSGKWLGTQYYEHQFLPQPRIVFEVAEARKVTRSVKIERPY